MRRADADVEKLQGNREGAARRATQSNPFRTRRGAAELLAAAWRGGYWAKHDSVPASMYPGWDLDAKLEQLPATNAKGGTMNEAITQQLAAMLEALRQIQAHLQLQEVHHAALGRDLAALRARLEVLLEAHRIKFLDEPSS